MYIIIKPTNLGKGQQQSEARQSASHHRLFDLHGCLTSGLHPVSVSGPFMAWIGWVESRTPTILPWTRLLAVGVASQLPFPAFPGPQSTQSVSAWSRLLVMSTYLLGRAGGVAEKTPCNTEPSRLNAKNPPRYGAFKTVVAKLERHGQPVAVGHKKTARSLVWSLGKRPAA